MRDGPTSWVVWTLNVYPCQAIQVLHLQIHGVTVRHHLHGSDRVRKTIVHSALMIHESSCNRSRFIHLLALSSHALWNLNLNWNFQYGTWLLYNNEWVLHAFRGIEAGNLRNLELLRSLRQSWWKGFVIQEASGSHMFMVLSALALAELILGWKCLKSPRILQIAIRYLLLRTNLVRNPFWKGRSYFEQIHWSFRRFLIAVPINLESFHRRTSILRDKVDRNSQDRSADNPCLFCLAETFACRKDRNMLTNRHAYT